jgi:tetratricopeptide (TPR) repeat protein
MLAAPSAFAQPFEHPVMARLFNREDSGINDARKLIEQGKYGDAQKLLQELAAKLPPSPGLNFDLAMAAFKAGDFDASASAIEQALQKNDVLNPKSPLKLNKAALLHAKGTILAEKANRMSVEKKPPREVRGVYRQAVDALVSALILNPENADTRRNVELAAVAAYPPCSSLDDKNEQNDSSSAATFLTPDPNTLQFTETMLLCPEDEDWFKMPLNKGETLFVSVQKPEAAQPAQPAPDPAGGAEGQGAKKPEPADVDVSLELADGNIISVSGKQGRYSAPESADGLVTLVRITGPSVEDGVDYVLNANVVPPCPSGDDQMEPNDTRESAKQASEGDLSLRICPLNDDWFGFTEKQGSAKQITLQYSTVDGPMELEVYTADGALMDVKSQAGEAGTVKSVMLPKAEQDASFMIRVFGPGTQGFYNLSIKDPEGGNQQNQQDQKKDEQQPPPKPDEQKPQGSRTMREMLDNLDNNGENLEAQEAARNTPMRDAKPSKDW